MGLTPTSYSMLSCTLFAILEPDPAFLGAEKGYSKCFRLTARSQPRCIAMILKSGEYGAEEGSHIAQENLEELDFLITKPADAQRTVAE